MSIIVDQVIQLPGPPSSRKTTYEAGVCEGPDGRGFMAFASYNAPNESFYIRRRGRTERDALKTLHSALEYLWQPLFNDDHPSKNHLLKLLRAVEKELKKP